MDTKNSSCLPVIVKGVVYVFTQSGDLVRTIGKSSPEREPDPQWEVERVSGYCPGNRMIVKANSLLEYGY